MALLQAAVGAIHKVITRNKPYVCPESVLVKRSFLYMNGSKTPFAHLQAESSATTPPTPPVPPAAGNASRFLNFP
jgi:hypothetical protein